MFALVCVLGVLGHGQLVLLIWRLRENRSHGRIMDWYSVSRHGGQEAKRLESHSPLQGLSSNGLTYTSSII